MKKIPDIYNYEATKQSHNNDIRNNKVKDNDQKNRSFYRFKKNRFNKNKSDRFKRNQINIFDVFCGIFVRSISNALFSLMMSKNKSKLLVSITQKICNIFGLKLASFLPIVFSTFAILIDGFVIFMFLYLINRNKNLLRLLYSMLIFVLTLGLYFV